MTPSSSPANDAPPDSTNSTELDSSLVQQAPADQFPSDNDSPSETQIKHLSSKSRNAVGADNSAALSWDNISPGEETDSIGALYTPSGVSLSFTTKKGLAHSAVSETSALSSLFHAVAEPAADALVDVAGFLTAQDDPKQASRDGSHASDSENIEAVSETSEALQSVPVGSVQTASKDSDSKNSAQPSPSRQNNQRISQTSLSASDQHVRSPASQHRPSSEKKVAQSNEAADSPRIEIAHTSPMGTSADEEERSGGMTSVNRKSTTPLRRRSEQIARPVQRSHDSSESPSAGTVLASGTFGTTVPRRASGSVTPRKHSVK